VFKIANSHGATWPSAIHAGEAGYAYMSYRYCAVYLNLVNDPQYAIELQNVYVVTPKADYTPEFTVKASITYPCRLHNMMLCATTDQYQPYSFNKTGGCYPYTGNSSSPTIEIGLDYSNRADLGNSTVKLGLFEYDFANNNLG
jgi:hypothetical protein